MGGVQLSIMNIPVTDDYRSTETPNSNSRFKSDECHAEKVMGDTHTADYITFHQVSVLARNITILLSCNTRLCNTRACDVTLTQIFIIHMKHEI